METEDPAAMAPEKNYYIDTNNIRVPRAKMEMKSFIKDSMSEYFCKSWNLTSSVTKTKQMEAEIA